MRHNTILHQEILTILIALYVKHYQEHCFSCRNLFFNLLHLFMNINRHIACEKCNNRMYTEQERLTGVDIKLPNKSAG